MNRHPPVDMGAFDPVQRAMTLMQFLGGIKDQELQEQQAARAHQAQLMEMQRSQQAMGQAEEMHPLQMQALVQQLQENKPEQVQQKNILTALAQTAVGPTGMPDLRYLMDYLRQTGGYRPQVEEPQQAENPFVNAQKQLKK